MAARWISSPINNININIIINCKLIAVLCRFDDFRSTSESNTVDSSYGGVSVSSAHDHVLEFNREGIIPSLHELILLSFDESNESDDDNGNDNGNIDSNIDSGDTNDDRPFDIVMIESDWQLLPCQQREYWL